MKFIINKRIKKSEKKQTKKTNVDTSKLLNFQNFKNAFGNSEDIKYRNILINNNPDMSVHLVYIDGLVNSSDVSNYVIKPLITEKKIIESKNLDDLIKKIQDGAIYFVSQSSVTDLDKVITEVMSRKLCTYF